jgi:predicted porin
MQKKLLTAAVAAALAMPGLALAQAASVEVYGTINMSFNKFKYSESTAGDPSVSKWDVASHASNYGLRGRENIGSGLTAWFQIEENAPLERSNNSAVKPASRNSAVGIQGGFGNVFVGQWTTPWADLDALWGIGTVGGWGPVTSIIGRRETTGTAPNPNCTNLGVTGQAGVCDAIEATGGIGSPFWKRVSNAVFYQSPVFSGAQIKAAYQTNEGKATAAGATNADPSLWSLSGQWAGMGGRARVGLAVDRHKDFTSAGNTDTGFAIKGGWNFGVVDLGAAIERMTYKATTGECKAKQYGLAAAVPVGPGFVRASWSKAKSLEGPSATCGTATAENGAKEYNIGYEHRFSKRTNVGIGYAKIDNDPAAVFTWTGAPPNQAGASNTPLLGSDPSAFFVSITHRF